MRFAATRVDPQRRSIKNESVLENDPRTPVAARRSSSGPSSADALMLLKSHVNADGVPLLKKGSESLCFGPKWQENAVGSFVSWGGVSERINDRFISQDRIESTDVQDLRQALVKAAESQGF